MKFSILSRVKSFKHAINGCAVLVKKEHNFRVHLLATVIALSLSYGFSIDWVEFMFVAGAIALVLVVEALNTCIEYLCNFLTLERNESIKKIKDIAAFAVLLSAVYAFIVGLVIFVPKIIDAI